MYKWEDGDEITAARLNSIMPVGSVITYTGSDAPNNFLICDGQAVSRETYADLFAVISTKYGVGDGSTTFNIPNLKGKVPVGLDSGDADFNDRGKSGGAKTHYHTLKTYNPSQGVSEYSKNFDIDTDAKSNLQPYLVINYIIRY